MDVNDYRTNRQYVEPLYQRENTEDQYYSRGVNRQRVYARRRKSSDSSQHHRRRIVDTDSPREFYNRSRFQPDDYRTVSQQLNSASQLENTGHQRYQRNGIMWNIGYYSSAQNQQIPRTFRGSNPSDPRYIYAERSSYNNTRLLNVDDRIRNVQSYKSIEGIRKNSKKRPRTNTSSLNIEVSTRANIPDAASTSTGSSQVMADYQNRSQKRVRFSETEVYTNRNKNNPIPEEIVNTQPTIRGPIGRMERSCFSPPRTKITKLPSNHVVSENLNAIPSTSGMHTTKNVNNPVSNESVVKNSVVIKKGVKKKYLAKQEMKHSLEDEKKIDRKDGMINKIEKLRKDNTKQLLILLKEQYNENVKISLLYEDDKPENLYDATICFEEEKNGLIECDFYKINYLQTRDNLLINYKILNVNDFGIRSYFKLYNKHLNEFGMRKVKNFTIITNLELNDKIIQAHKIKIIRNSNLCKLEFNKDHILYKKLVWDTEINTLARNIAGYINQKSKEVKLTKKFKRYHIALIRERVFETRNFQENGRSVRIAKFHHDFRNNANDLSDAAKNLRKILTNLLGPIDDHFDSSTYVSSNFGTHSLLDRIPHISKPMKLVDQILNAIKMYFDTKQIVEIPGNDDLHLTIGRFFERKEGIMVFTQSFMRKMVDEAGNLREVLNDLERKCIHGGIDWSRLSECKFKISNLDEGLIEISESLPNDDESIVLKFLDNLQFQIIRRDTDQLLKENNLEVFTSLDKEMSEAIYQELSNHIQLPSQNANLLNSLKLVVLRINLERNTLEFPISKIKFTRETLEKLHNYLLNENEIVYLNTKFIELYVQKIYQMAEDVSEYRVNSNFFIFEMCVFDDKKVEILTLFKQPETKLLVIRKDKQQNDIIASSDRENIKKILSEFADKKFIVLNETSEKSSNFDQVDSFDISDDSYQEIQNASLYLYEGKILYKNLMISDDFELFITTPQFLTQYINGDLKIEEKLEIPNGFDTKFYIPARIIRNVIINPEIFKNNIKDVFIISNIEESNLKEFLVDPQKLRQYHQLNDLEFSTRFILIKNEKQSPTFEQFVEANEQCNIHLIKYEFGDFVWKKSHNNIASLFDFASEKLISNSTGQKINDDIKETVIISGESGAGKTVYLYNEAKRIIDQPENRTWLIPVILSKFFLSEYLNVSLSNLDTALNILAEILKINNFQKDIFFKCANGQYNMKIVVIFDGFDELNSKYSDFVIELICLLQKSKIHKIYLPTNPNFKNELERKFNTFAYNLDDFTKNEKNQLFIKHMDGQPGQINELLQPFFEKQWNLLPQHLTMLAEIYNQTKSLDASEFEKIVDLYKRYISTFPRGNIEEYEKLSVKRLINNEYFERLCNLNISIDHEKLYHVTISEYLAANWLSKHTHDTEIMTMLDCVNNHLDKLSPIFFLTIYELLHLKANSQEKFNEFVNYFAIYGFDKFLEASLQCEQFDINTQLLHNVIESNNENSLKIIEIILKQRNDINDNKGIMLHGTFRRQEYSESGLVKFINRKNSNDQNALQITMRSSNKNRLKIACMLLLHGADDSNLLSDHRLELASYVANELQNVEVYEFHYLRPLAEKLFYYKPLAIVKSCNMKKILSYFITHGRVRILKEILGTIYNEEERYNLIKDSDYLLHSNGTLSDKERLHITRYLLDTCDIKKRNKNFESKILQGAAISGHLKTFTYYIGANIDKYIDFLKISLQTNQLKCIDFLMKKTEWITDPTTGDQPLHLAVRLGVSLKTIKHLIEKGGIENENKSKETPLCIALKETGDMNMIKYLVDKNARLNAVDSSSMYAWCYVILKESSRFEKEEVNELMDYFLNKSQYPAEIPPNSNLSYIYENQRDEVFRKFHYYANPNIYDFNLKNCDGYSRLHVAIRGEKIERESEWCRFLIIHGADVNSRDKVNKTPLHWALERQNYYVAKILLQYGAMFDAEDNDGNVPKLQNPSDADDYKIVRRVLKDASKLFLEKTFSTTIKKLFPKNEADIKISHTRYLLNCCNKNGSSLLHMAALVNDRTAIKEIMRFGEKLKKIYTDFKLPDINGMDKNFNTPIHLAAEKGYHEMVNELLSNGANFDCINKKSLTPLKIAEDRKHTEVIKVLESARKIFEIVASGDASQFEALRSKEKYNFKMKNRQNLTVLHVLAKTHTENSSKILDELLKINQRIVLDLLDKQKKTPLHHAIDVDNKEIVKKLLKAGAIYDLKDDKNLRAFDKELKDGNESLKMLQAIHKLFEDIKSDNPEIFNDDCPKILLDYLNKVKNSYDIELDVIVNVLDHKKNTLLHYAAKYDMTNAIENLLKCGGIYNMKNKFNEKPVNLAISSKQLFDSIDKLFRNKNINTWKNSKLDEDIIVNCRESGGHTLLSKCVKSRENREINWLRDH